MKRTIRVDPIVYDRYDAGEPLRAACIFLHGFGSTRDGEKARFFAEALPARGCAFLAPDQQGHGESGGSFEDLTIGRAISDLLRVAEDPVFRAAPRRFLIGSSLGALVGMWAAVDRPGLFERMALIAPALGFLERLLSSLPAESAEAWRRGEPLRMKNAWLDVRLSNRILLEGPSRATDELLRRFETPSLILHGGRDEAVPVGVSWDFFRKSRAPLEMLLLSEGDHRLTAWKETLAAEVVRYFGLRPA